MAVFDQRRSAKVKIHTAAICALACAHVSVAPAAISSRHDIDVALEEAVKCKLDAINVFNGSMFNGGPDDTSVALASLGVDVKTEPQHGGEVRYRFPQGVRAFGYEAIDARYSSPSMTIFYVTLRASSQQLHSISKKLKLTAIPAGRPNGYGFFDEFQASYIRKLHAEEGSEPNTIFSAKRKYGSSIVVGCQNLSW